MSVGRQAVRSTIGRIVRKFRRVVGIDARRQRRRWIDGGYASPAPDKVKRAVLRRVGGAADHWIETGTYLGDTTAFLAAGGAKVTTIEPGPDLARAATRRFADVGNVEVLEGLSEDLLPGVLEGVSGRVCLWLDGHFSSGITYHGPVDTPIQLELAALQPHLARLDQCVVFVDDFRCFDPTNPEYSSYPSRSWLVEWADSNGFAWTVEHDIFIATRNR